MVTRLTDALQDILFPDTFLPWGMERIFDLPVFIFTLIFLIFLYDNHILELLAEVTDWFPEVEPDD